MKRRLCINSFFLLLCLLLISGCSNSKKDYQEAENLGTIEAYETFLLKYPQGQFADAARKKIEEIERKKATSLGIIEAYETFLQKHPQSLFADAQNKKLMRLISTN